MVTDGIDDPNCDSIDYGYGGWLRTGCINCIKALHTSQLLKLTSGVDWESIKEGQRPLFRVSIVSYVNMHVPMTYSILNSRTNSPNCVARGGKL